MNRALAFLLWRRRVNGVRQYWRGLANPRRLLGTVLWLALISFMVWAQVYAQRQRGIASPESAAQVMKMLVAMTMIMSVFGGVVQRGLAFQPADIDFLFPGPFTRRSLILYRLCSIYPLALLSSFFFTVIFGMRVPNHGLAFIGLALAQAVAVHLQAIAALVAVTINERVFARMRRSMQLFATLVAGLGIVVLMTSMFGGGTFSDHVREWLATPVARVIFYPAVAVEELALATEFADAMRTASQLVLFAAGTLLIAVSLQVRFFEASIETSRRVTRVLALAGRGIPATAGRDAPGAR